MMMMMGNMGGGSMGGGSMGMGSMGSMGNMGNMGNMSGGMSGGMPMADPSAMGGINMSGMGGMNMGGSVNMSGMADPNAMSGMAGHGAMVAQNTAGFAGGFDINSLLTGLFTFAINIFAVLLVVALVVGVIVFVKRYLFDGLSGGLKVAATTVKCAECGQTMDASWYCCPKCGVVKAKPQILNGPVVPTQSV